MTKPRQPKATKTQVSMLVDYLALHPHVARNQFMGPHGNQRLQGSWQEIVDMLNAEAPEGKGKTVSSWRNTWRDNKGALSKKVAALKKAKARTGNPACEMDFNLTEMEKKILGITGLDYIEGMEETPDSFPEEQPNAIALLAEGKDDILYAPPTNLKLHTPVKNGLEDESEEFPPFFGDFLVPDPAANPERSIPSEAPLFGGSENAGGSSRHLPNPIAPKTSTRRLKPSGLKRDRLGIQLQDARKEFAELQERQVSAIEILAKAAVMSAENDKDRIKVMRTMAENELVLAETMTKVCEVLTNVMEKLKN